MIFVHILRLTDSQNHVKLRKLPQALPFSVLSKIAAGIFENEPSIVHIEALDANAVNVETFSRPVENVSLVVAMRLTKIKRLHPSWKYVALKDVERETIQLACAVERSKLDAIAREKVSAQCPKVEFLNSHGETVKIFLYEHERAKLMIRASKERKDPKLVWFTDPKTGRRTLVSSDYAARKQNPAAYEKKRPKPKGSLFDFDAYEQAQASENASESLDVSSFIERPKDSFQQVPARNENGRIIYWKRVKATSEARTVIVHVAIFRDGKWTEGKDEIIPISPDSDVRSVAVDIAHLYDAQAASKDRLHDPKRLVGFTWTNPETGKQERISRSEMFRSEHKPRKHEERRKAKPVMARQKRNADLKWKARARDSVARFSEG